MQYRSQSVCNNFVWPLLINICMNVFEFTFELCSLFTGGRHSGCGSSVPIVLYDGTLFHQQYNIINCLLLMAVIKNTLIACSCNHPTKSVSVLFNGSSQYLCSINFYIQYTQLSNQTQHRVASWQAQSHNKIIILTNYWDAAANMFLQVAKIEKKTPLKTNCLAHSSK